MSQTEALLASLRDAARIVLFVDYDGTIAEFSSTPADVQPRPEVLEVLQRLLACRGLAVAIVTGRDLAKIEKLLPMPGLWLAGTYGIEWRSADGQRATRADLGQLRPTLERLKPRLARLLDGRSGFFLEDKGWTLALHARWAEEAEAVSVLAAARQVGEEAPADLFRLLGGHRFFEICPRHASKKAAVEYLLGRFAAPDAMVVYLGDDDKDEEAFPLVLERGGHAIRVGNRAEPTVARCHLDSPAQAREWLHRLAAIRGC